MREIYIDGEGEVRNRDNDKKVICPLKVAKEAFTHRFEPCERRCAWFSIVPKLGTPAIENAALCQSKIIIGKIIE